MEAFEFFNKKKIAYALGVLLYTLLMPSKICAQINDSLPPDVLKKLSLEELMDMEIVSLSKTPENLTEVASAVQVITNLAIQRSTATRLPEAMQLAANLQVAQSNSHDWAVTARGFNGAPLSNNTLANKLLVMIDGRSVYTPLFGGVFWDAQNVMLEDVDRIEVVSGPGGTLWGENAVNGIINVITKSSRETQGQYLSGAAGTFLRNWIGARHGGKIGKDLYYRVYGQHYNQRNTTRLDGTASNDYWRMAQGGFRMDFYPSEKNTLMLEGNLYSGREGDSNTLLDGQNVLTRWRRTFSNASTVILQVYFDRTWRILPDPDFAEELTTYDLDGQYSFAAGPWNRLTLGVGYRQMFDKSNNSELLSFFPQTLNFSLFSAFVQDEITLFEEIKIYAGAKFTHNDFSGFGVQPSLRLAWLPNGKNTFWLSSTRALRSPSRFDADVFTPNITGNENFQWERMTAYEGGYRFRPFQNLSFSLALFFNNYNDLRSINANPENPPPLLFANNQQAETAGAELSGIFQPCTWWHVRGGYTFMKKNIWAETEMVIPESALFEALDPENQFLVQSMMDLPLNFQLDIISRFVDRLPKSAITPAVSDYFALDMRIARQMGKLTLSLAGRNILKNKQREFGSVEIPRNIFGKVTWRF